MEACPSRRPNSESHHRPPSFHPSRPPTRWPAARPPAGPPAGASGIPGDPGATEHSLEQGVSCINILSKQPFGLRALREKMINIISLTSSKFGVYKAILAERHAGWWDPWAAVSGLLPGRQHGCAGLGYTGECYEGETQACPRRKGAPQTSGLPGRGAGSVFTLAAMHRCPALGRNLFFRSQFTLHLLQEALAPPHSWPFSFFL